MKVCPYCAEEIQDAAIKCRYCGSAIEGAAGAEQLTDGKLRAKQHPSYWQLTTVAVVVPLAGLVVGIGYLLKPLPIEKKLGEHLIAVSLLMGFLFWAALAVLGFMNA